MALPNPKWFATAHRHFPVSGHQSETVFHSKERCKDTTLFGKVNPRKTPKKCF